MSLDLKSLVRTIPDYPKKGILFRDITTLIEHPERFRESVERIAANYRGKGITHVAGIEARGFIFGAAVAVQLGVGFVPIRKPGKLPIKTIGVDYHLEYGVDRLEMDPGAVACGQRVVLVDDLIATGGTARAAAELLRQSGAVVDRANFVIDLPDLGGATSLNDIEVETCALLAYPGH